MSDKLQQIEAQVAYHEGRIKELKALLELVDEALSADPKAKIVAVKEKKKRVYKQPRFTLNGYKPKKGKHGTEYTRHILSFLKSHSGPVRNHELRSVVDLNMPTGTISNIMRNLAKRKIVKNLGRGVWQRI